MKPLRGLEKLSNFARSHQQVTGQSCQPKFPDSRSLLLSTVYHQFLLSRVSSERPAPKEWVQKRKRICSHLV